MGGVPRYANRVRLTLFLWTQIQDVRTEVKRSPPLLVHQGWWVFFLLTGEYECSLRERFMGVHKLKCEWVLMGFEQLVGWDLSQIWQGTI